MNPIRRVLDHAADIPVFQEGPTLAQARRGAERTITRAVIFGMEVQDADLGIIEHSALVAKTAEWLGERLAISEADSYVLKTAAELHEVGMFSVAPELLLRNARLSLDELEMVRRQATLSARLASVMHGPRVGRLIEHQYDDYEQRTFAAHDPDELLAGILRVADVIAAVRRPRPYQAALSLHEQSRLLESGSGSRFHPLAVRCALSIA
ncbi:MAG: hypothetical protein KY464_05750 [Gemmatimonadetes bacterium]|nr:hypothetical protein [Gemmatimonadota bacterium]